MTNPPQKPPKDKLFKIRLGVLLVVMGIASLLLIYDFKIAEPGSESAYQNLVSMHERGMVAKVDSGVSINKLSPVEVQKVVGFAPSLSEAKNDEFLVETYQWRRGLPFLSYKVYVVYRGIKSPVLENVTINDYPDSELMIFTPKKNRFPRGSTDDPQKLPNTTKST